MDIEFTIDRINAMLRSEGMPRCEDFTRSIPGISREAQACGALERKWRFDGLQTEHLRYHMVDGVRTKLLLGERVMDLCAEYLVRAMQNPDVEWLAGSAEIFVPINLDRAEELRVGKDRVSKCRTRCTPF